jgi:predicted unusual protein kinase regulating ubiquinone biosynthesis (AarF/ABC1/UbiB family)
MDFIDGWKITEVHRWPAGVDRQDLAMRLVEAFGFLTFQEGLIHGDPHPGNVFVQVPDLNPQKARPVLLDWGLVQQVNKSERLAMARWAVAALSQDRVLYLSALRDLGFVFTDDFEEADIDEWLESATWTLRDSIPTAAQQNFNQRMNKQREEAAAAKEGKRVRTVESVPGKVLFFLRGLKMLQDICGRLDVTVPFAKVVLLYALPLLEAPGTRQPTLPLPAPRGCSAMETAVRKKLEELRAAGSLVRRWLS